MSPQRGPWTGKDTAECVGMLVLTAGALTACTGNLSLTDMGAYAQTLGELALPVVVGVGATVLALGVAMLLLGRLRVLMARAARLWWCYRRRWAQVMAAQGLTTEAAGVVSTPRIVSVHTTPDGADVVTVRILPGQSVAQWHEASAELAAAFDATEARVSFTPKRTDIALTFRTGPAPTRREPLALPAPKVHPIPLRMPVQGMPQGRQHRAGEQVAMQVAGLRLQIVWARVAPTVNNGKQGSFTTRQRWGLWGQLRWCTTWAAVTI